MPLRVPVARPVLTCVAGLAAVLAATTGCDRTPPPPAASSVSAGPAGRAGTPSPSASPSSGLTSYHALRAYRQVPAPVAVRIPSLQISSGLERLGVTGSGQIQPPSQPLRAGWYAQGPRPGEPGRAVILGHLDSRTGPGIFYRLPLLRPGAEVDVARADGSRVTFTVTSVGRYAKRSFPTDLVYAPTLKAGLALVTCGGPIDPTTGHYRDNVIVFADPAGGTP